MPPMLPTRWRGSTSFAMLSKIELTGSRIGKQCHHTSPSVTTSISPDSQNSHPLPSDIVQACRHTWHVAIGEKAVAEITVAKRAETVTNVYMRVISCQSGAHTERGSGDINYICTGSIEMDRMLYHGLRHGLSQAVAQSRMPSRMTPYSPCQPVCCHSGNTWPREHTGRVTRLRQWVNDLLYCSNKKIQKYSSGTIDIDCHERKLTRYRYPACTETWPRSDRSSRCLHKAAKNEAAEQQSGTT